MSKSLAELRASTLTSLPVWSYTLCLAQGLVAEVQRIEEAIFDLLPEEGSEAADSPARLVPRVPEEIAALEARKEELHVEMREHSGELRLRSKPAGEWRRFVDANPPREDSKVDELVAFGLCSADAVLEALGDFAVSWNGTDLAEGDWEFIANRAAAGDLKEICRQVVQMHELRGARAPKSLTPSSTTESTVSS